MRPRAIQGVPGLKPISSPSDRFEQFARMIVSVPKTEAGREMEKFEAAIARRKQSDGGKKKNSKD